MTSCPDCGEPVLEPCPGMLLEPEAHHLGIHRPDGSSLNSADIRARVQGHRKHWCDTKTAADNQLDLFGTAGGVHVTSPDHTANAPPHDTDEWGDV